MDCSGARLSLSDLKLKISPFALPMTARKTIQRTSAIFTACFIATQPIRAEETTIAHKYADSVSAFAQAPKPAPGGILMVGSSIFFKWKSYAQDLAPLPITNRAFGGSRTSDQLFFFNEVVPSSRANLVVWYCGSNDINGKKTPDFIVENTKRWITQTQSVLPNAHILLVSVIRAPQKRKSNFLLQVDEVNKQLLELTTSTKNLTYADVNPILEDSSGNPLAACYVEDDLHLTPEGYRRMTSVLLPLMTQEWKLASIPRPIGTP
jgi:hypothetical protein